MNDDQITALSREYAEWICPYKDKSANLSILDIREAERLINFLLRRFCLVEKRKVAIKYNNAKRLEEDATAFGFEKHRNNAIVIKSLIESLFPEIAKEVEG